MTFAFLLILIIGFWIFVIPALLKWLWNMTIPELFGLKELRFWQAFRLIIIASLLTGGGSLITFNNNYKNKISELSTSSEPFVPNIDNNLIRLPIEDCITEAK